MNKLLLAVFLVLNSNYVLSNDPSGNIIGSLATDQHFVEVWRVEGESKYIVKNKNGKALTTKLSVTELANNYPELSKVVEEGIADDASLGPDIRKVPGINKH